MYLFEIKETKLKILGSNGLNPDAKKNCCGCNSCLYMTTTLYVCKDCNTFKLKIIYKH